MGQSSKDRLPDFIIIGAMKCGTTSIHHILSQHDGIFLPAGEPYFFDVDEIEQRGDFFIRTPQGWTFHDYEKDFELFLATFADRSYRDIPNMPAYNPSTIGGQLK